MCLHFRSGKLVLTDRWKCTFEVETFVQFKLIANDELGSWCLKG